LVKKEEIREGRKASRASKQNCPRPLAQCLDPPLLRTRVLVNCVSLYKLVGDVCDTSLKFDFISMRRFTQFRWSICGSSVMVVLLGLP